MKRTLILVAFLATGTTRSAGTTLGVFGSFGPHTSDLCSLCTLDADFCSLASGLLVTSDHESRGLHESLTTNQENDANL